MSINYDLMKSLINTLTECFLDQSHKSIIVDFSTFNEESRLTTLKKLLNSQLIGVEQEYYNENKQQLDNLDNFEQLLLEVFYNDLVMKDYSSCMILTKEQYSRKQILNDKMLPLEYFQYNQSTIKRACVLTKEIGLKPKQLDQDLRQYGVQGRPAIQLINFKLEYNLDDEQQNNQLNDLAQNIRASQLDNLVPIVDIKFKTTKLQQLITTAKIAYSNINQAFVENSVEPEYLIFCTNLPDLVIEAFGNPKHQGLYANQQFAQQVGYIVFKILFYSIPPSYGAIFFTFDRGFLESKSILHFLNNINQFKEYITWPFGVVLNANVFDEVAKSYSIVRRQQSATITINQILKVFQDCLQGVYKEEAESEILKPIQVGQI